MSVELLRDAEGREIPLDTTVLYDQDGNEMEVSRYQYYPKVGPGYWNLRSVRNKYYRTDEVYLTPPDSWEKLEEDITRAINALKPYNFDSMTCGYFDNAGSSCQECKKKNGFDSFNCNTVAWKDILSRIRKLRGEDE